MSDHDQRYPTRQGKRAARIYPLQLTRETTWEFHILLLPCHAILSISSRSTTETGRFCSIVHQASSGLVVSALHRLVI
jgi:hypothetical protein